MSNSVQLVLGYSQYKENGKCWLAAVSGKHPKYGFRRDFIIAVGRDRSRSGKTGTNTYAIEDGLYEVLDRDGRQYLKVAGGEKQWLDLAAFIAEVEALNG